MHFTHPRRWRSVALTATVALALIGPAVSSGLSPRPAGAVAPAAGRVLSSSAAVTPTVTLTTTALPTAVLTPTATLTHTATSTATSRPAATATSRPAATATTRATSAATPTRTARAAATVTATTRPAATATSTARPAATATSTAAPVVKATLRVVPTRIGQGGLAFATGAGFLPGEKVVISLRGQALTTALALTGVLPPTGFGIPYTTTAGLHVVTASGATSKRVATTTITVTAVHPTLQANVTTAQPGTAVTVNGCGFAPTERIVLALNGSALVSTPAVITTTAAGCFTAGLRAPAGLLEGLNTLSATGSTSRATAQVSLQGRLPVAATWYFAGASTFGGETPRLSLLNPNGQSATVTVTIMAVGRPPVSTTLTAAAHARLTVDLRNTVGAGVQFGLVVRANRTISAGLTQLRANADQWSTPGISAPMTSWYLAEGYTGLTFKETISILNPGGTPAIVTLRLLPFNGKAPRTVTYTLAGERELVVRVNDLMPRQSVSALITSTQPVVTQRTMTFGTGDYGAHAKLGSNLSSVTWFLAEGSTLNGFETFLTVLNPNPAQEAFVTASYFSRTGASLGNQTIRIDPLHRGNFKLNDLVRSSGIATIVSSNVPVVVERPMYFGPPNGGPSGGSDVFGRNGTGTNWTFPEGNTATMREFLLMFNPSGRTAKVRSTFYTASGRVVTYTRTVLPFSRANVDVNRDVLGLPQGEHGVVVESINNVGIVVEQSIYDSTFRQGSSSQGIAQ
ncbi:MAG: hypothetical protein NVSMB65_05620 [Chloroflexota bacterium]